MLFFRFSRHTLWRSLVALSIADLSEQCSLQCYTALAFSCSNFASIGSNVCSDSISALASFDCVAARGCFRTGLGSSLCLLFRDFGLLPTWMIPETVFFETRPLLAFHHEVLQDKTNTPCPCMSHPLWRR